jgi:hypothetical protein
MAKADYRTKARECYRMAAMAPSPADQATWLKLASEWLAMSSGRGVPVLTSSTLVKPEAAQTTTRAPFRFAMKGADQMVERSGRPFLTASPSTQQSSARQYKAG